MLFNFPKFKSNKNIRLSLKKEIKKLPNINKTITIKTNYSVANLPIL